MTRCQNRKNETQGDIYNEEKKPSINIMDDAILPKADLCGMISGAKEDKPVLFEFPAYEYFKMGELIAPCLSYAKAKKEVK